jgi:hypothetical protein
MIEAIKLAEKVWYFKNAIENPKEIFESLDSWMPVANQDYMETSIVSTKSYLEDSDNAIFKCLDIWYNANQHLNPDSYKLMPKTHFYKRGAGGGYSPHTDFAAMPDGTYEEVTATILGYFADPADFGDGEITFPDYDIVLKPEIGSIVIFGNKVRHGVNDVAFGQRGLGSTFLVKNNIFYKSIMVDPKNISKQEELHIREEFPQYESKNGNIDLSKQIGEE